MPKFKCDILSIFQIQCDTVQIQDLLFYVFLNDLWFSKVSWLSTNKINEGGKIGLRRILSWRNPISISKKANFHKNVIYDGFSGLIPHTHIVWKLLKMSHLNFFNFCLFHQFLVLLKLTCLVTLFVRKLQVFKNSPKWTIFGIFD